MKKILILPILITLLFLSACSLYNQEGGKKSHETKSENVDYDKESEVEISSDTLLEKEEFEIDEKNESSITEGDRELTDLGSEGKEKEKVKEIEQAKNNLVSISDIFDISQKFINTYLVDQDSTAIVRDVVLEDCYYKLEVEVSSMDEIVYSYIDKAGLIFFPIALDIDSINSSIAEKNKKYSEDELKEKAINFINKYLISDSEASVLSIKKEDCLYKLEVEVSSMDEPAYSYISEDGKMFFSSGLNIEEIEVETVDQNKNNSDEVKINTKNNKPVVELFVMSHCPYGLQMQKALLPVIKLLDNSIDFSIKFNTYAMHGAIELDEQTLQYCLMKEKEFNYLNYLECFLVDGDSNRCLIEANINKDILNNCISEVDEKYGISYNFNNKINYQGSYPSFSIFSVDNNKYGVQGSPSLVINGKIVYVERTPNDLLKTICSAFITKPKACQESLSMKSPKPGFGFSESNTNSSNAVCS